MKTWVSRTLIIIGIMAVAFVLGHLAVRGFMNALVGGTMFGGNFLWAKRKRKVEDYLYFYAFLHLL